MTGLPWRRGLGSVASAGAAASLAGLLVAAFDAASAAGAQHAPFGPVLLATLGLVAPLALALGVVVGCAVWLLLPADLAARAATWFNPSDASERRQRALELGLAPLALLAWLIVCARSALFVLSSELEPAIAGVALALAVIALGALLARVVERAGFAVRSSARALPRPLASLLAGVVVAAAVLLLAIVTGAPSGAGGPLSLFGVLTRDELDLRPLGLLAIIALAGSCAPTLKSGRALAVAIAIALLPLVLTRRASVTGLDEPATALAIERSAPLASKLLAAFRKLSDADHDGYSARFGGGDCDDRSADVNPGADDVPANHVDEDCSGADAEAVAAPPRAPVAARTEPRTALPDALNVVLLTVDTLRADLGYAGNPRKISPELDRLAAESVVFERAYSLASYTAKSLPPMLIGRYSSETHRGYSHFNRFERADTFVAERLQRAGVHTVSVQGHWYFFQNFGMERGFDVIDSSAAPRAAQSAEGDRSVTSERLSDAVIEQLANPELARRPFFLWAHYTDPHAEYVSHPGFDFGSGSRAAYDGEVAFVDQQIGRVIRALEQSPSWARTAVIVTSDHGEAFGEHGMIRHGFELWEELIRVPLILRVPGVPARRIAERRSAIDVVPTILDLLHVPAPSAASDALSGQSLLPDLMLTDGATPRPRPVFVDMAQGPHNEERRALIEGDRKLVMSAGRPIGLYDLARDPDEKHDELADKRALNEALARYRAFKQTLREVFVRPTR